MQSRKRTSIKRTEACHTLIVAIKPRSGGSKYNREIQMTKYIGRNLIKNFLREEKRNVNNERNLKSVAHHLEDEEEKKKKKRGLRKWRDGKGGFGRCWRNIEDLSLGTQLAMEQRSDHPEKHVLVSTNTSVLASQALHSHQTFHLRRPFRQVFLCLRMTVQAAVKKCLRSIFFKNEIGIWKHG